MQTFTIQQLQGMVGMTIPRVEARIINVYAKKTGEGQYGPWSLQNGVVEDATGKMKVVFSSIGDMSDRVGEMTVFRSTEGKKGTNGVQVKKSEYQGKETIELWITKAALIVQSDDEDPNVERVADSPRAPATTKKEVKTPLTPKDVSHDDRKLDIMKAKNRLTQLAGLYDLCWKTVLSMELTKEDNFDYSDLKDIATTLFIQSTKEGLIDCMPIRTLSKFYNEEAIKPANPKSPEMPMYPEDEDKGEEPF